MSRWNNRSLILTIAALTVIPVGIACAADLPGAQPNSCTADPLRFINSDILDASIESRIITACPTIEILGSTNMSLEAFSPRLDRWLVKVVENGGGVSIRSDAEREVSRSLTSSVLKALISIAWDSYRASRKSKREKALAAAAGQYDATVFVDESTSRITAVMLTRRAQ